MERRQSQSQSQSESESAVIKAAAWAWYQHGSGSEGKPDREFDILSTGRAPGPSRYKLEAMRLADNDSETKDGSSSRLSIINLSPSHIDNTLLDPYEVGRISKHLEYLVESSSGSYYRESHASGGGNGDHQTDGSSSPESRKKKSMRLNAFSMRLNAFLLRHSRICGSRGDVVEGRMLGLSRQRPKQYGSVVGLAKCNPRAKDAK